MSVPVFNEGFSTVEQQMSENRDEPGMGVENSTPNVPPQREAGKPGATPRGPLQQDPEYRHLGVRLTIPLHDAVTAAARADGSGTSAFVRNMLADALGIEAPIDRVDGVRVPPAELAGLSVALGHTTQLVLASRDLGDGQAAGAVMALERAHERLVRVIEKMER